MAVTSIWHVWSGETWDDDAEGARSYTELYRVTSNDPAESPQAIKAAVGGPGTAHPTDPTAFLRSRSASRSSESRLVWEVTLTYGFDPKDPDDPVDNPLNEPTKYRWTAGAYTKPTIKDRNDDAVVNSAGDYFDPPPEVEEPRWSVNVQKNVASVPLAVLTYAGRVNSAGFTVDGVSVLAEKAKIIALDISEYQEKNDIGYRVFTYTVEFREEGWGLEVLDQGYRIIDPADATKRVDILVDDEETPPGKQRPSVPVLLNGAGGKLANPSPTTAVFLTFPVHKTLDFTVLPGIS